MADFNFEDLAGFDVSGTCEVLEAGGVDPTSLIRTNQNWSVRVRLQTQGFLTPFIGGNWRLRVRLESLGNGADFDLPIAGDQLQALTPGIGPINYLVNINTASGVVAAGVYKMVTTVTYANGGVPGPIAGYCEGPILQFYVA